MTTCQHAPQDWVDKPAYNGWIRTYCRCGKWIGNRPEVIKRGKRGLLAAKGSQQENDTTYQED